jgi:hypothetical protein
MHHLNSAAQCVDALNERHNEKASKKEYSLKKAYHAHRASFSIETGNSVREVVSSSIKERDHFRIPRGCRSCRPWAVPSPKAQGHTDVGNPYRYPGQRESMWTGL